MTVPERRPYPRPHRRADSDPRSVMAAPLPSNGLVYEDLERFPDDGLRRELIRGELIVTPSPRTRHQRVVAVLTARLYGFQQQHGGVVLPAPSDVLFADDTVLEPDVLFVTAAHRDRVGERYTDGPPDLVVEVSSPSTRRLELVRKREVYERFAAPGGRPDPFLEQKPERARGECSRNAPVRRPSGADATPTPTPRCRRARGAGASSRAACALVPSWPPASPGRPGVAAPRRRGSGGP